MLVRACKKNKENLKYVFIFSNGSLSLEKNLKVACEFRT